MLKKEQQIQEFLSTFAFLKGETVILYGTGQYTELLFQAELPFRVAGLMDLRKTGTVCWGLPVLSEDQVRRSGCRHMILIANLSSAPAICRRIGPFVRECGITVYCMNGRRPLEEPGELPLPPNWAGSSAALLAEAENYDVISFDLFDTLIARRCLLPEGVFSLAARRAREAGIPIPEDFVSRRQAAERTLYRGGQPWYRLEDVCRFLEADLPLPLGAAAQLRQLELEAELEMVHPRPDMVRLYHRLLREGKRVVVTTDMYLTAEQLRPLLEKCGLAGAEVYVSCEQEASKHRETLFQVLRERFPGQCILHIGDNPRSDVENARKNGVGGALIPSAAAWMEALEIPQASDPRMRALFAQRCFASAFPLEGGRVRIDDPEDAGYLFFGPLAAGYLAWLVRELTARRMDRVLFVSRDGYLFHRLYRRIRPLYGGLPEADYFLTSRRCAGTASLRTEEDVRFLYEDVCCSRDMALGEMLERVCGLAADGDDEAAAHTVGQLGPGAAWEHLRSRYLPRILDRAAEERTRYLRYIRSLELDGARTGMMNFVGRGVTQRCLQALLGRPLTGFYFALEYDSARILEGSEAAAWYPEMISTHTGRRKLAEQLLLGETVFSAPQGAVLVFSEDGEPVYEETTKERAALVESCHRGILAYLEDILALNGGLEGLEYTVDTADAIFGLLCDGRFRLSDEIRESFRFEDRFQKT